MKYLTLILGVLALGSVACAEEPEPGVIEFTGSAYVQITGELNGEPNAVTGLLMLGLVQGLTEGNCWGGNTNGHLVGTWLDREFMQRLESLAWSEYYGGIVYEGGDGSCDSVVYIGVTQQWPYPGTWSLWEADLYRCIGAPVVDCIMIAERSPHGGFGDTVHYLDYVQPSWELTAHLADASGEGNFGTAQLTYDLAEGMGYDNMPYGLYLDFIYNNADTSRRTVSAETWANTDTTEVRAIYTTQDTMRNRANDTLYGINLINSRSGFTARDTSNYYIPPNNAVKWVQTIYLVKWPGGTP